MVLISIIIGLAITHLLTGVADAIDRSNDEDKPEIFSPLVAFWGTTVFFWMVNFWWFQYRLMSIEGAWTLWRYLFIILYAVSLYSLASILIPRDWGAIKRYTEYFMRNRRYFFAALLLATVADVTDSWLKGGWGYVLGMGPFNNSSVLEQHRAVDVADVIAAGQRQRHLQFAAHDLQRRA